MVPVRLRTLCCLLVLLVPSVSGAADVTLRGIAIDRALDAPLVDVPGAPGGLTPIVRIGIGEFNDITAARLERIVSDYEARHMRVIVALGALPSADADLEPWRRLLQVTAERCRGKVAAYQIGSVGVDRAPDAAQYAYVLKLAAVQLHAADDGALVLQGWVRPANLQWQREVLAAGVASYLDGVAIGGPEAADGDAYRADVRQMSAVILREKPSATIVAGPIRLPAGAAEATGVVVEAALRSLAEGTHVTAFDGEAAAIRSALSGSTATMELLSRDLVTLDDRASGVRLRRDGADVTADVRHQLLYSTSAAETYFLYWSASPVEFEATVRNAPTPKVRDPLTGALRNPIRVTRRGDVLSLALPGATHAQIVDFNFGNASSVITNIEVRKDALPRVEEIVARHQQAQAAQTAALRSFIAHVRIEQHFRPTPADPAYNVVTENRLFSDRSGTEWEELSFSMNGATWTSNRPSFPLVQPEKVLSLPLDLRLNQDYAYRLAGVDTIDGRAAYVVRFEPTAAAQALYRGTVWIDRATFLRLKVQAVETRLSGPVVSNDETQLLSRVGEADGRGIWLADRLIVKQVLLIAGRSVLVERETRLTDFVLNSQEYDQERKSARDSNRIMYRDTDQGVRYLVKEGESRVVSDHLTTSTKALAFGVDVDPSLDYPLPIGGIDIIDFNFLNRNLQLALLYGGVIALGNVQRANLWGGRFDASVDFSAIAVKVNDDLFDAAGKRSGQGLERIPASVGVNLGYQASPHQKVGFHYEWRYDAYFRDAATDVSFAVPASTSTNSEGASYEYRRRGYSLILNGAWSRRSSWDVWGNDGTFDGSTKSYTKYDVGLSKDFVFRTFHTIHLNEAFFGGEHLDRFSKYQFGMFDPTRMHGVPSAVRFSDLAMFRGSYSFNLLEVYRFDVFVEHARGRDAQLSSDWLPVTGLGARVTFRTPRSTVLQIDVGRGILPDAYRGAGSTVLQVLLLKPL